MTSKVIKGKSTTSPLQQLQNEKRQLRRQIAVVDELREAFRHHRSCKTWADLHRVVSLESGPSRNGAAR